jgi:AraC-like DNA-binding protein
MHLRHHNPGDLQLRLLQCVTARLNRWDHDNLSAPYWRLYLLSGKGAAVRWRGRITPLDPRHAWLIGPDTDFGAILEKPVTQCYVHFTLTPAFASGPGVYPTKLTPVMRMLHACAADGSGSDVAPGSASATAPSLPLPPPPPSPSLSPFLSPSPEASIIAWNALVLLALGGLPPGTLRERRLDARVLRVLEHIERDIAGPHTLGKFARVAGMHARALIRLFRHETGVTPMASLRARRVALACDLLHHSNRPIDDIAALTGFCDRYHFTKTFRRLREMSPGAFRQLQRQA